jgi:hypothetical protein
MLYQREICYTVYQYSIELDNDNCTLGAGNPSAIFKFR